MTAPNPGWVPSYIGASINRTLEDLGLAYAASPYFESTMTSSAYADYFSALEDALTAMQTLRGKI